MTCSLHLVSDFDHKKQRFVGGMSIGGINGNDRFVPSKDSGDLRTSHHLMEDGGGSPSTPSKSIQANVLCYILKSSHLLEHLYRPTPIASGYGSASSHLPHPPADIYSLST